MKKIFVLSLLVLGLCAFSVGCSSSSGFSLCRGGSLWPTSRTSSERVFLNSGSSSCDPCTPCNPCDPVPAPCDTCIPLGITPGPQN